jgi:hypothetical protein
MVARHAVNNAAVSFCMIGHPENCSSSHDRGNSAGLPPAVMHDFYASGRILVSGQETCQGFIHMFLFFWKNSPRPA